MVVRGLLVVLLDGALDFEDEDFLFEEDTSLIRGSSANSLQNGVVQRHALMLEDPGSDISLKLHSSSAVKGLSIGPNNTLVGKHSLKTDVSVEDFFQAYKRQASLEPHVPTWFGSRLLNSSHSLLGSNKLLQEKHCNAPLNFGRRTSFCGSNTEEDAGLGRRFDEGFCLSD